MHDLTRKTGGTFHARLREVEPDLFGAEYPGEMNSSDAGPETFPDAQIGTDASGVRSWVEEMAAGLGYDRVVWETAEHPGTRASKT
jgi:hypothetical protein